MYFRCKKQTMTDTPNDEDIMFVSAEAIAKRIVILTYLNFIVDNTIPKTEVVEFLQKQDVWTDVSPSEQVLFLATSISQKEAAIIAWQVESIFLLLWCINKIEDMPIPNKECNLDLVIQQLPKYLQDTQPFISSASLRNEEEIYNMLEVLNRFYQTAKEFTQKKQQLPLNLNSIIIDERYHTINWVCGIYNNWDDVEED